MIFYRSFLLLVACGFPMRVSAADSDGANSDVDRHVFEALKLAPDPDEYYQQLAAWNETKIDDLLHLQESLTVDRAGLYVIIDEDEEHFDQDERELKLLQSSEYHRLRAHELTRAISGTQHTPALQKEWVDAHNIRRKAWHTKYGKSYVPVKWNEPLAQGAKEWAEKLLDGCGQGPPYHDHTTYGENLASNLGTGIWGKLKPPEEILHRWVDNEATVGWHDNAHLTQALWRATKYIGCHDAAKDHFGSTGKGVCHVQVCRYAMTGNCNMGAYQKYQGDWHWLTPMLMDTSPCPPECPPNGCN